MVIFTTTPCNDIHYTSPWWFLLPYLTEICDICHTTSQWYPSWHPPSTVISVYPPHSNIRHANPWYPSLHHLISVMSPCSDICHAIQYLLGSLWKAENDSYLPLIIHLTIFNVNERNWEDTLQKINFKFDLKIKEIVN